MTVPCRVVPVGDSMLRVEFDERIDEGINARVTALSRAVTAMGTPGILDVVPAYRSLAVYFDPLRTDIDQLMRDLTRLANDGTVDEVIDKGPIRVPVCYGGACGPDLGVVAGFAGLSERDVIEIHASGLYRVFMLGFAPGFAYLGTVDPRIAAPRRPTPRTKVPPGSVAIAGRQTGIYPLETPGGWQIVGRTPMRPFDPNRASPFLLAPGDRVRFDPVDEAEYVRLAKAIEEQA